MSATTRPSMVMAGLALALSAFAAGATQPASVQPGAAQGPAPCLVGADLRGFAQDLPNARAAIAAGQPITIVAIGSSSTQGLGASSEERTYPAVLQDELSRLLGGHEIKVVNAGVGSNSAHQMYLRLDQDVVAEEPKLVIWQTGVMDAIHDIGIDRFKRILRKGIAKMREAGIDVVLMDHQPLPRSDRYALYRDYMMALRAVAVETNTPVFRRFDVMNQLIEAGRLRQEEIFSTDASHTVDGGYFCTGANLARSIADKLSPRAAPEAQR